MVSHEFTSHSVFQRQATKCAWLRFRQEAVRPSITACCCCQQGRHPPKRVIIVGYGGA